MPIFLPPLGPSNGVAQATPGVGTVHLRYTEIFRAGENLTKFWGFGEIFEDFWMGMDGKCWEKSKKHKKSGVWGQGGGGRGRLWVNVPVLSNTLV